MGKDKEIQAISRSGSRRGMALRWAFIILLLMIAGYLASLIHFRVDLTADKRYTLSQETKRMLADLEDLVFINVYLEGEMPLGFKKMRREVMELLDEFKIGARNKLAFTFVNPSAETDPALRNEFQAGLEERGVNPHIITERTAEGGTNRMIVFPGATIHHKNRFVAANFLLPYIRGRGEEENINLSIQNLEYSIARAIRSITNEEIKKIAFIEGHGELDQVSVADITSELARYYEVYRGLIDTENPNLDEYATIIIAKPKGKYNEPEKFVLDQYIMNGGTILWLIDLVEVNKDSLSTGENTLALITDLNLDDQLFRYGVRINPGLVKDIQCALIPVNTALAGERPRFTPAPWQYYPLLAARNPHPITQNLNLVKGEYMGYIDTLASLSGVSHEVLLNTSQYTKIVNAPTFISLRQIDDPPIQDEYFNGFRPVAVLLEGEFQSVFTNRPVNDYKLSSDKSFSIRSKRTSMIVVSDGDLIRNEVSWRGTQPEPVPLGYDRFVNDTYGNKEFIMNAIHYLADDGGLMQLRTRELRLRLLDKARLLQEHKKWKWINILFPPLLVLIAAIAIRFRKRLRYGSVS